MLLDQRTITAFLGASSELPDELPPLSAKQRQVLTYLFKYFMAHRFYPTNREIMQHIGVRGTTAVAYLSPLEAKGYIERTSSSARNVKISVRGLEYLKFLGSASREEQLTLYE
jgi:DNA-binding MarR family transcriptional regulator